MFFALPPLAFLSALAFRIRGGGFISLTVTACRFGWGTIMGLVFLSFAALNGNLGIAAYGYAAALVILGYLSLLVPHAAYQNMGRWPSPQKTWPAFFLPDTTQDEWDSFSPGARIDHDCAGMAGVGFFRGAIVFVPYAVLGYCLGDIDAVMRAALALSTMIILQPLAYLVGRFTNISLGKSLPAESAEWGEFWNGATWALALGWL